MTYRKWIVIILTALAIAALAAPITAQEADAEDLIAVLESPADTETKARACQRLADLGSVAAVPALAELLADQQLNTYARTALEDIPDASASQALLAALDALGGAQLVGVIHSLGQRRENAAVEPLAGIIETGGENAARAALVALGKIATPRAASVLLRGLQEGSAEEVAAAVGPAIACADTCVEEGRTADAVALYTALRSPDMPAHVRLAAIGQTMILRGDASADLLGRYLASGDLAERRMALRAVREMPGTAVTRTLIEAAEDADAELRLTLIEILSERDDPAAQQAADELGFAPLFDGETFEGWEGDTEESFRIEDGAIVGGSLEEPIPHNEFLCTTEEYGDFILRLQVKAVDANGGIQFRSHRVEGSSEVSGYQADFDAHGIYWGCLYDESRRGMLVAVDQEMMKDIVDPDGWNDYEIRCEGPRIRLYVNGHQTVDYTEEDPQIPREGIIGLQVHSGPPSETWYRNIEIMELP